jgi:acetylornithine deacetylase/succinyl-diaminopimelate desuccinylase-like protein
MDFSAFDAWVDAHAQDALHNLIELCRLPSVQGRTAALEATVARVMEYADDAGLHAGTVRIRANNPPIIMGESDPRGEKETSGKPLLMVYNHYDVQPEDPLDEWISPPFEPTIRDGHLYARGVADNKVNLVARVFAVQAWRAVYGDLPVQLRFVWEGEEESGGEQLAAFTKEYANWIAEADGCLWESGYRDDSGAPVLSLGVKGLACLELRCRTGTSDAHSGQGGLVPNAIWTLINALSTLRAPDGTVTIDGFQERIAPPTAADLALLDALPWNGDEYRARYGVEALVGGRTGKAALEALFFGTTCTINGISGGYEGEGHKTVVPCEARAKIDLRLVPNLDPRTVVGLIRDHLARRGFHQIEVIEFEGNTMPARTPPNTAIAQAAIEALRAASGRTPIVYPISPGSGPMYELCQAHGVPAANFGCGWSGSHVHAPNENVRVVDFIEGIKAFGRLIEAFPRHMPERVR